MKVTSKLQEVNLSQSKEITLSGTSICRGVALGVPFSFTVSELNVTSYSVPSQKIESEISRYSKALKKSKHDLRLLQEKLEGEGVEDGALILEAQQQMLSDPLLTTVIENKIREKKENAEAVFYRAVTEYQRQFDIMVDPFFRERSKDIEDISRRVMGHLSTRVRVSFSDLPADSIVIAKELNPSDVAEADSHQIAAFVTESDGETSHAAIVAKAKGIPFVSGVNFLQLQQLHIEKMIVDGSAGTVILNPHEDTSQRYETMRKEIALRIHEIGLNAALKAETYDGCEISVSANIDVLTEMECLHTYGASGIGLFRSECMFLTNENFPSEEEQFEVYEKLVQKMRDLPVVIRTFDVGGDKFLMNQTDLSENPFLGCRAIRFLLKEKEIFKIQLRAILRASAKGNVRIMFPMVSALSEVRQAKELLEEAKQELDAEGVAFDPKILIGCMIEVPSAAIVADLLAKECDFLSIGTNDLVQYSLAVDRGNQEVSGMYTPTDPSVIRLIKLIVSEANRQGVSVTVCGEVAADPRFTPLLLGLGVNELSVATRNIPLVKHAIRSTSIVESSELANHVLSLPTADAIKEHLSAAYHDIL